MKHHQVLLSARSEMDEATRLLASESLDAMLHMVLFAVEARGGGGGWWWPPSHPQSGSSELRHQVDFSMVVALVAEDVLGCIAHRLEELRAGSPPWLSRWGKCSKVITSEVRTYPVDISESQAAICTVFVYHQQVALLTQDHQGSTNRNHHALGRMASAAGDCPRPRVPIAARSKFSNSWEAPATQ